MKEYFKKSQRFVALVLTVLVAFTMMPVHSFAATSNKGVAWDGSDRDTAQATRKITWAGSIKATADGGAVTSTLKATLSGDTFTAKSKALAPSAYTVSKKPAGLTVSIAVDKTGRVATVKLSGKASARKDITNFGITFKDSAFTGKKASSVTGYSKLTNAITFVGVSKLTIPTPTTAIVAGAKKAVTVEGFNMGSTVNVKLYDAAGKVVSTTGATIARASGATSKKIVFNITTKATLKAGTYTAKALIGNSIKKTATFKVAAPAPVTYTVKYDKNGATGTVSDATKYKKDATVTVKAHTGFTYADHTFAGWNTKSDGKGTSYAAGATFKITGNTTLFAIWDKVVAPTVTGLAIKTAPVVAYTVGDKLDLTKLVVTLTMSDGKTEDVAFADFTAKGLTATPANETVLAATDVKVTVKHTASGKTVDQTITVTPVGVEKFTVTFDAKEGLPVPTAVVVDKGAKVTEPTAPSKEGFTFGGWYKEEALTTAWIFDTDMVNVDITLHAKWTVAAVEKFTVTFDAKEGLPVPVAVEVEKGAKVSEPTAPARTGFTFGGWYKEVALTTAWVFTTDTVTADITLIAKWDAITDVDQLAVDAEKAKYEAAVTIEKSVLAAADVTAKVAKLQATKTADATINVSFAEKVETAYLTTVYNSVVLAKQAPIGATDNTAVVTLTFSKNGKTATLDVTVTIEPQVPLAVSSVSVVSSKLITVVLTNIPATQPTLADFAVKIGTLPVDATAVTPVSGEVKSFNLTVDLTDKKGFVSVNDTAATTESDFTGLVKITSVKVVDTLTYEITLNNGTAGLARTNFAAVGNTAYASAVLAETAAKAATAGNNIADVANGVVVKPGTNNTTYVITLNTAVTQTVGNYFAIALKASTALKLDESVASLRFAVQPASVILDATSDAGPFANNTSIGGLVATKSYVVQVLSGVNTSKFVDKTGLVYSTQQMVTGVTSITNLTNGVTYLIKESTAANVIVEGAMGVAGDKTITGLTGSYYLLIVDGAGADNNKYITTSTGTPASSAVQLSVAAVTGLVNGVKYQIASSIITLSKVEQITTAGTTTGDLEITFAEDAAWRSKVSKIVLTKTDTATAGLANAEVLVANVTSTAGKLSVAKAKLPAGLNGTYDVVVAAVGYANAIQPGVAIDLVAPVLTIGKTDRSSNTAATATLTCNEAITNVATGVGLFYKVDNSAVEPTYTAAGSVTTTGVNTLSLTMGVGAKVVTVVAIDAAGNKSNQIAMPIDAFQLGLPDGTYNVASTLTKASDVRLNGDKIEVYDATGNSQYGPGSGGYSKFVEVLKVLAVGDSFRAATGAVDIVSINHTAASNRTVVLGDNIKANATLSLKGPASTGTNKLTVTGTTSVAPVIIGGSVDVSDIGLTATTVTLDPATTLGDVTITAGTKDVTLHTGLTTNVKIISAKVITNSTGSTKFVAIGEGNIVSMATGATLTLDTNNKITSASSFATTLLKGSFDFNTVAAGTVGTYIGVTPGGMDTVVVNATKAIASVGINAAQTDLVTLVDGGQITVSTNGIIAANDKLLTVTAGTVNFVPASPDDIKGDITVDATAIAINSNMNIQSGKTLTLSGATIATVNAPRTLGFKPGATTPAKAVLASTAKIVLTPGAHLSDGSADILTASSIATPPTNTEFLGAGATIAGSTTIGTLVVSGTASTIKLVDATSVCTIEAGKTLKLDADTSLIATTASISTNAGFTVKGTLDIATGKKLKFGVAGGTDFDEKLTLSPNGVLAANGASIVKGTGTADSNIVATDDTVDSLILEATAGKLTLSGNQGIDASAWTLPLNAGLDVLTGGQLTLGSADKFAKMIVTGDDNPAKLDIHGILEIAAKGGLSVTHSNKGGQVIVHPGASLKAVKLSADDTLAVGEIVCVSSYDTSTQVGGFRILSGGKLTLGLVDVVGTAAPAQIIPEANAYVLIGGGTTNFDTNYVRVQGAAKLGANLTLTADETGIEWLSVRSGSTLTIPSGITLTDTAGCAIAVDGILVVESGGKLDTLAGSLTTNSTTGEKTIRMIAGALVAAKATTHFVDGTTAYTNGSPSTVIAAATGATGVSANALRAGDYVATAAAGADGAFTRTATN